MSGRNRWIGVGIIVGAVVVRVAAILVLQSHHVPHSTYEHGEIAASIVEGRGFSMRFLGAEGLTSQQAPAYPYIVAAAYALGGVERPEALLILQLGQAVLAGLMVLGVLRLASWVIPDHPTAILTAAAIAAFHPTLIYAATMVQVALLAATLLVWVLVWAARAGGSGSYRDASAAGALLALTALTDPILGLVGLGAAAAIFIGRPSEAPNRRRAWTLTAAMFGVALVGVTPWTIRNAMVHGEFVPVKSTFGYAFWQGNCSITQGTDKVVRSSVDDILSAPGAASDLATYNQTLWRARHKAGYIDDVAFTNEFKAYLGTLPEPERSRVLLRMALVEIRDDPGRYARLCARRMQYFWLFDESNPRTRDPLYRASHIGLTLMAAFGLALATPGARRRLAPLVITALTLAMFHSLTIVSARFHIPIEPLMAVWAGAGVAGLAARWPARSGSPDSISVAAGQVEGVGIVGRLG